MIDTSLFADGGRDLRSLRKTVTVNTLPRAVFDAWTTAEGIAGFLKREAHVELRIGGPFEIFFIPESPAGPIGSNGCQVLAYVPDRMFAFSWTAPPSFPEERSRRTWVALTFEPAGDGMTMVTLTHQGFGTGQGWDAVYAYFDAAWESVLEELQGHFAATS